MDKYQSDFINNLKFYRTKKNLSQAQFAELCNVSTGTIGNIECGIAKPSFDLIIVMSKILDITPADLFAETNESSKKQNLDVIEEHKLLTNIYEILNKYFTK